jgi:pyridoxine 5-phosphate synthase
MARLCIKVELAARFRELGRALHIDPVVAAMYAEVGGADGIVCTLKEEFRPVRERDVQMLREIVKTHLNLQVPPLERIMGRVLSFNPDMITFIPWKKPGTTPGGGLDVLGLGDKLARLIQDIRAQGVVVSVLVEPIIQQVKAAAKAGVDYVEFHMGKYVATEDLNERIDQIENCASVALAASKLGLGVAASQGLDYQNVAQIASIEKIEEINIGEAVFTRAFWIGMEQAVRDMVALVH